MVVQHVQEGKEMIMSVEDNHPIVKLLSGMLNGELVHVFIVGGEATISTIGSIQEVNWHFIRCKISAIFDLKF